MRWFSWLFRRRKQVEQDPELESLLITDVPAEPVSPLALQPPATPIAALGPAVGTSTSLLLTEALPASPPAPTGSVVIDLSPAKHNSAAEIKDILHAAPAEPADVDQPLVDDTPTEVSAHIIEIPSIPLAAPVVPGAVDLPLVKKAEEAALPTCSVEAYIKERDLYFTPGLYSPSIHGAPFLLGPDLSFSVRSENSRKPVTPLLAPSASAVSARRVPRHLMDEFVTARSGPPPAAAPVISAVDPILLTAFFSDREDGPSVPAQATEAYLTEPALLALSLKLRDHVLAVWRSGAAPLSTSQLYSMARDLTGHSGTALLLCHNLAKAFSRGGKAIRWELVDRSVPAYFDGHARITAVRSHQGGVLRSDALAPPSIFYLLFSPRELAVSDPGDWYRYFAAAAIASYTSQALTVGTAAAPAGSPAESVALRVLDAAHTIRDETIENTPAYRGWVWSNALSFEESATWGRSRARIRDAGRAMLKGAMFGLSTATQSVDPKWRWHIPAGGGGTAEVLDPNACI